MNIGTLHWLSLGAFSLLLIGWIGYPIAIRIAAAARRSPPAPEPSSRARSTVTVVVATREDPAIIAGRVSNLRSLHYPQSLLHIVIGVDHTAGFSLSAYRDSVGGAAQVVCGDAPGGKAATLNAAVRASESDILVFTDSCQEFEKQAVSALEEYLMTSGYDIATGTLNISPAGYRKSLLDLFWIYELALRRGEAKMRSVVAVTGAIYAMRRAVWTPIPAGLICDDLFVPMVATQFGYRVGFCEHAHAYDPRKFSREQEFRRKVRTLTGLLQFCSQRPSVLLPWKNPIWIQFVCHKLLRIATPYLLVLAALGPLAWVARLPLEFFLVAGGATLLVLIGVAIWRPSVLRRIGSAGIWIFSLLAAPIVACSRAARGRWNVWESTGR